MAHVSVEASATVSLSTHTSTTRRGRPVSTLSSGGGSGRSGAGAVAHIGLEARIPFPLQHLRARQPARARLGSSGGRSGAGAVANVGVEAGVSFLLVLAHLGARQKVLPVQVPASCEALCVMKHSSVQQSSHVTVQKTLERTRESCQSRNLRTAASECFWAASSLSYTAAGSPALQQHVHRIACLIVSEASARPPFCSGPAFFAAEGTQTSAPVGAAVVLCEVGVVSRILLMLVPVRLGLVQHRHLRRQFAFLRDSDTQARQS